jgi:glucose-1-phosphate thymidylyltransferase
MKAIILAGGYAKRLWPLTKETPKPLLDVGGKEIMTRIVEKIEDIEEIDEIAISTNAKFEEP